MAAVERITSELYQERASALAKEALELSMQGLKEHASRKLREAAALGHDNPDVQIAFLAIHNDSSTCPVLNLCRRYALYHDQQAGEKAVRFLRTGDSNKLGKDALEAVQIILESNHASLTASQDSLVGELYRHSPLVRQYFAQEVQDSTTEFFDNLYSRGDDAANCLRSVVLDTTLWSDNAARLRVEDDLFLLFMAKLMESGHDHDGRALQGIALLLIADTERLSALIDEDAFDALLTSLDIRWTPRVRGQATLVLSKFLETAEATALEYFINFVKVHIERKTGDDLILAFSAAASFFLIAPTATAQLFLATDFLRSIMPFLERPVGSATVHDAFLALLNAACVDSSCRTAIAQQCAPWLDHKISNGKSKQPAMAANIMAKLRTAGVKPADQRAHRADDDVSALVDLFTHTLTVEEDRNISDSIEGLAYTSLKPEVKEKLAHDKAFLKNLLDALAANDTIPEIIIGGLSILTNLTQYAPNLSEEQKRLTQLKAYANASKPNDPNPLENEDRVQSRCSAVLEAGVVPALVKLNKNMSTATTQLIDKILLSLSRNPKDRGKLAQQGAVKLLVSHAQKALQLSSQSTSPQHDAAHALARILISLDPSLVFPASTTPHITDAIPPLAALIKTPPSEGLSDQPRDLLPVFESLLALTNLASSPDQTAANSIIRLAWEDIEDLLLNNNKLLRRAACELICNLTPFPSGAAKFADGSRRAKQRLHILVAMADVDDIQTRRAAGGALAMLSEHDSAIRAILELERGVEILLDLCNDQDSGIMHRGLVVVRNIVCEEGEVGKLGREKVKEKGGIEKLKESLRKTKDPNLLQIGVEALKILT